MFCKHDYDVLREIETESEIEKVHNMGYRPNTLMSSAKKLIVLLKCSKCKKIKKLVMKI